jgi:hypothetical protein
LNILCYRIRQDLKINKLITTSSKWQKKQRNQTQELLSAVDVKKWREKFPDMVGSYEKLNPEPDFDGLVKKVMDMWLNQDSYPNENLKI